MNTTLTITIDDVSTPGLLVSLKTGGDFASEAIDRRFYSLTGQPPDNIQPAEFWGQMLTMVGSFLTNID